MNLKRYLPSIRSKIYTHLQACEEELRGLGETSEGGLSLSHQKTILLSIISKFCTNFNDLITGKNCISKSGEIFGGARINYVFNEVFRNKINSVNPFAVLSDQDIRITIRNSNGLNPSLLVSEAAFEMLVKDQISSRR
jgi:dynamin 1-like protein